jgi:uncharacterized protein (TIGR02757 family)
LKPSITRDELISLYETYNRREYVHPDPLEFLYNYPDLADREIVGLIASGLAYGAVRQILKSVGAALDRLGPSPSKTLSQADPTDLIKLMDGFKHRFTTGDEMARFLHAVKLTKQEHGSLGACFSKGMSKTDRNIIPAASKFVKVIYGHFGGRPRSLLPDPDAGSACKRLNLFLRWMIRKDDVDPGGWDDVPASLLIVPVDVHMHRIGCMLGMTCRKTADLKTALEITNAFRQLEPDDPVKYDFALTRFGIRDDLDVNEIPCVCN